MPWTRARIALVTCSAVSAVAMLYAGCFQIGWLERLWCPGFGSGCESVAMAPFSFPLGLASGLLLAALSGLIAALAQVERREAAAGLVLAAFVNLLAHLVLLLQMQKLGAHSLWNWLCAVLAVPVAALSVVCGRDSERGRGAVSAAVPPDDRAQEQQ